ncbi:MAG: VCBS repeat-containing protein, partial [Deltaproteobacteria bacterium]|nr:VCBS repeat-containing protein [Deltaproteobacteria bacterium]
LGRGTSPVINARPKDMDGDGDLDVVAASWGDSTIWVFENAAGTWKTHRVHHGEPVIIGFMMELDDLNGDGRIDIVSSSGPRFEHRDEIRWFEQPKTLGGSWDHHLIGSLDPDKATGLQLVDINDDGRKDLFAGGYSWEPWDHEPENPAPEDVSGRLAWFEAPSDPTEPWTRHDVSRRRRGMFDLFQVVDLSNGGAGDGLPDILTTRGNSGHYDGVIWLEQVRTAAPGPTFTAARSKDSPELPLPRARVASRR